jgi:uncharacterized protein (DUF302 family)
MSVEGLVTTPSPHDPVETLERLRAGILARSLTIFAEVDHAAGPHAVSMPLRPLVLLLFGAAKGGTPLMQAAATAGVDLPLKLLVWQDEAGATKVSYNDPNWVAKRHHLGGEVAGPVNAMAALLAALVKAAVA